MSQPHREGAMGGNAGDASTLTIINEADQAINKEPI